MKSRGALQRLRVPLLHLSPGSTYRTMCIESTSQLTTAFAAKKTVAGTIHHVC